jgi:hypothetical protein
MGAAVGRTLSFFAREQIVKVLVQLLVTYKVTWLSSQYFWPTLVLLLRLDMFVVSL